MRRSAFAVVLLLAVFGFPSAHAAEAFCRRDLQAVFCAFFRHSNPLDANGATNFPNVGDSFDGSKPYVVTGNDHIDVADGSDIDAPVWTTTGIKAIFLFDNASVAMNGISVSIAATIYVCDNASLTVTDSSYRSNAIAKFQYYIWFSGTSRGLFKNVALDTHSASAPATQPTNLWFWVRERSTVVLQNVWSVRAISLDSLQVSVADSANCTQIDMHVMEESYISGDATSTFINVSWTDLFFEACPGTGTMTLSNLPELCSLAGGTGGCFTPTHAPLDYSIGPPQAAFTVNMVRTKVFSWAPILYSGSSVVLRDNPVKANIGVGIGGLFTHQDGGRVQLSAMDGANPYLRGLANHSITVENTTVIVWQLWPTSDRGDGTTVARYTVETTPGSRIGDILSSKDVRVIVRDTNMSLGHMQSIDASNPVVIHGGSTRYEMRAKAGGYISLADNLLFLQGSTIVVDNGGRMFNYDITVPSSSSVTVFAGGLVATLTISQPKRGETLAIDPAVSSTLQLEGTASAGSGSLNVTVWASGGGALISATAVAALPSSLAVSSLFGGATTGAFTLVVRFASDTDPSSYGCRRLVALPGGGATASPQPPTATTTASPETATAAPRPITTATPVQRSATESLLTRGTLVLALLSFTTLLMCIL